MPRRLLLIGWEAADWNVLRPLMEAGDMPALGRLVKHGVWGALLPVQPQVAAIQWTSVATGKRAWQHGVCHSRELVPGGGNSVLPITARSRRSAALWDILAHEGRRSLAAGWPATHDTLRGAAQIVSDRYPEPTAPPGVKPWPPAAPGSYWPEEIRAALDPLRVSPEEVGAEIVARYVPRWRQVDQKRDRRLGQLRVLLAADFSYHTAIGRLMASNAWEFAAVRFPALGDVSRLFPPLNRTKQDLNSAAESPCVGTRPPVAEGEKLADDAPAVLPTSGAEDESQPYCDVVNSHCRMLDLMLHRLVDLAGPEVAVIVVSAQGAPHPGSHRRTIALDADAWKASHGVFAASGPGFARGVCLQGASVLDVAPTILTWFGLPIGDDMEGRVLLESFPAATGIERVPSWEARMGFTGPIQPDDAEVTLGNRPDEILRRESDWNYAQSCLEAGRYEEARLPLERLFRSFPENAETGHAFFQCQLALGRLAEAQETLEIVLETLPTGVMSLLPRAELAWAKRDMRQARALVGQARQLGSNHPPAMRRLGMLLLRLREWDALAELANRALQLDENDALAWIGLAEAQLRKGEAAKAAASAQRAIRLQFFLPEAHFVLARALVAQGDWPQARDAMQTLLKLQPNHRTAPAYLKRMKP